MPPVGKFPIGFGGGVSVAATAIQVKRNVVTLTYAVGANLLPRHGQTVRMDYRKPTGAGAMPLRDLSANEVENFIDRLVTNNTPPAFASASVDGAALTITFNGALDPDSVPAEDAFTVTVEGSAVDLADTNPVSISGSTVTLTLAEPVAGSLLPVTVGYTAPDSNPLRDADMAKHPVPDFAAQSVANNTSGDTTPPGIESVQIRGRTLTITFNERLDENSVPLASQFTANIGGVRHTATGVQVDRNVVTVTFSVAASHGGTVSYNYTKNGQVGAKPLRDLSANEVAPVTNTSVTNNTPPAFASAAVDGATLTITFNGALDPDSVPSEDAFTVTVAGSEVDLADTATVVPLVLGQESTHSGVPHAPTGTATPGPGPGEITLTWEPATMGPANIAGWQILAAEQSIGNVTGAFDLVTDPNVRSYTLTGLKTGVTWTVGVAALVRAGVLGDVAQARLEAAEGPGLTVANPVSLSGSTVTLTLAEPVAGSLLPVTVGYTAPATNPLRDADMENYPVPNFTGKAVTNNTTGDTTPPGIESVQMNGATLTITFNERLDENSVPGTGRFVAAIGASSVNPTGIQVDRNVVTLTFAAEHTAAHGQVVRLGYTQPTGAGATPLRDLSSNNVATFSQQPVTNNTPPVFSMAAVNGTALTITFNGALDADSVPAADAFRVAAGSSGTQTLALGLDVANVNSPHRPTGTAEPGPGPGQITLKWQPATTGPQSTNYLWVIYAAEISTGNVQRVHRSGLSAGTRSFTLSGLKTGVTWTVGVAASDETGVLLIPGDIAQARLKAPAAVELAATNPVSISGSTVTLNLASAVTSGQMVTVGYTAPATGNKLRDADNAKNPVPDFTGQSVTNNTS